MMIDLRGKVALVTGAASAIGIGFAAARRLGEQGAGVVLTDIDGDGAATRAAELEAAGIAAAGIRHDVRDEAGWDAALASALARFGRLDILVNNAGLAYTGPILECPIDDWEAQFQVNARGTFLGTRAAIRQFRAQAGGGAIVNVASMAAIVGFSGNSAYCGTKGGVRMFSKAVALECAAEGIRVNCVHPGLIATDIQRKSFARRPQGHDEVMTAPPIPAGHVGAPADIAAAIAFLASDDAKYITGTELIVDGGFTAA